MAVKLALIVLTALTGSYSHDVPSKWYFDRHNRYFNGNCTDSNGRTVKIESTQSTIYIKCLTSVQEPVLIDLETFPRLNINKTFPGIRIENCTIPEGHSFGGLLKHFGIIEGVVTLEGYNIGSSLNGRFSDGFETLKGLTIINNKKLQLNEDAFRSLPKLSKLELSRNEISNLPEKVFESLGELNLLKLNDNRLTRLHEGMFLQQKKLNALYLDNNKLKGLTKKMFEGLVSLTILSLEKNLLQNVTDDVLHNTPKLRQFSFGNNNIRMPYNIFANCKDLKIVHLRKVKITNGLNLSGVEKLQIKWSDVWTISGISNVKTISITESRVKPLVVNSFENLSDLESLDLSTNKLSGLCDGLFHGLEKLTHLKLSNNNLRNISRHMFRDLKNLIEIDLSDNHLTSIHPDAFANTTQLKTVILNNNRLSSGNGCSPFMHLNKLKILNLSNNNLTKIPSDLIDIKKLEVLDLSVNKITTFKYSELRDTNINLSSTHEIRLAPESSVVIYLNDNPLACDCGMYNFLSGKEDNLADGFGHNCLGLRPCYDQVDSSQKCPDKCYCSKRENEPGYQMVISCKAKGLTTVPDIADMDGVTSIELDISDNNLTKLPKLKSNSLVTIIQASHNRISNIEIENLPPSLRVLDVSHNDIQTISANIFQQLKIHQNLEILFLSKNPLLCDCSEDTAKLLAFTKENISITDLQNEECKTSSQISYKLTNDFMAKYCITHLYMHIFIVLTILAVLTATVGIVFYKHEQFIKVWLYAHNIFLCWVDEEYVDKDKKFDAFIAYSKYDADLAHFLVKSLENGCPSFKLCVHERDFVGGESIEKSIHQSLDNSRRTIVILSKHFLESVWTIHEFHLAYTKSIAEKRNRLIIIKHGEIGDIDDTIIETYIKTHTYIDSDDHWFLEKIRYALPHKALK